MKCESNASFALIEPSLLHQVDHQSHLPLRGENHCLPVVGPDRVFLHPLCDSIVLSEIDTHRASKTTTLIRLFIDLCMGSIIATAAILLRLPEHIMKIAKLNPSNGHHVEAITCQSTYIDMLLGAPPPFQAPWALLV